MREIPFFFFSLSLSARMIISRARNNILNTANGERATMSEFKTRKPIPQGVRFNVLRRDNFTCRYCGRSSPAVILHLDHVKAHTHGGADVEANLVTSCLDCNAGKSAKSGVVPPPMCEKDLAEPDGLVGMMGHTFEEGEIQYQFEIVGRATEKLYRVQLYSWMGGWPTDIAVWPEDVFLPPTKLYDSHEARNRAYEIYCTKRRERA